MMDEKIAFAECVLLLDVDFMNLLVEPIRQPGGGRPELPYVEWGSWLSYLALDAGIKSGSNELQVLLLHKEGESEVRCCQPASLEALNGQACQAPLGEIQFACVPTAGMTTPQALYLNLLQLALDAKDVKHLLLLPHPAYTEAVVDELTDLFSEKPALASKVTLFTLKPQEVTLPCKVDTAFFSLAKAFGL